MNPVSLAALVAGIVYVAQYYGLPSRWLPLLAIALAVVLRSVDHFFPDLLQNYVVDGVTIGVTLTGGVGIVKDTAEKIALRVRTSSPPPPSDAAR